MQKEQKKERKRVKEIKSGWGEERKGTAVREIRRRKGREERKERKRERKDRERGTREKGSKTESQEKEKEKGKEKRRKENQNGRRSSPREVILQVYGVHVCSGSAYASAGRQGSWLERKGKKETLSPGQKPSRLAATKSGSVPEGREETALPQVRWVGTAARVPGWKSCKGQGGRDP